MVPASFEIFMSFSVLFYAIIHTSVVLHMPKMVMISDIMFDYVLI